RLMYPSGDGFKVVYRESVRPEKAIPPNKIKRTVIVNILVEKSLLLDLHQKFSLVMIGDQFMRRTYVAFAIWGMFEQLTEFISIALHCFDGRSRLNDQQAKGSFVELQLVNDRTRNYNVVTLAYFQFSERR